MRDISSNHKVSGKLKALMLRCLINFSGKLLSSSSLNRIFLLGMTFSDEHHRLHCFLLPAAVVLCFSQSVQVFHPATFVWSIFFVVQDPAGQWAGNCLGPCSSSRAALVVLLCVSPVLEVTPSQECFHIHVVQNKLSQQRPFSFISWQGKWVFACAVPPVDAKGRQKVPVGGRQVSK